MNNIYKAHIHRVNRLVNDLELLYHQAALIFDIPDSSLCILYMLHEKGDNCLLSGICKESGISKQTINSALRKLEMEGILYLEQDIGKSKRVHLTEKGKDYVEETAARLFEAECNAFNSWTIEEVEMYLKLMEKYNASFRIQIEQFLR